MTAATATPAVQHRPLRRFGRHYAEMLIAMFLGMAVLGLPVLAALGAAGVTSAELHHDAPAALLIVMATLMTVPMVAWMRYRGHGWAASNEMAAAMFVPTFAAIALLATGVAGGTETLLTIQHAAMLPAMLVAMLFRLDEYTGSHHA
jgi:hypothetical protein